MHIPLRISHFLFVASSAYLGAAACLFFCVPGTISLSLPLSAATPRQVFRDQTMLDTVKGVKPRNVYRSRLKAAMIKEKE